MMDLQTALLGIVIFVISGAILLFISMFGIKEKSYEEALAEQRQQTNSLLGFQNRSKPKEKKQKKTGKKVKEKQISANNESETAEESESVEQPPLSDSSSSTVTNEHSKHHVEFTEPATIEEPLKDTTVKKRLKKDKMRPILVNRDMSEETVVLDDICDTPSANHFEQLHPKDDFELELLHSHIKGEQVAKQEPVKEKLVKVKQNVETEAKNAKKATKQTTEVVAATVPEKEEIVAVIPQTNGFVSNSGKDKKKKKSELNTIHQLTGDKQGVNLAILTTLVRKAELSRSEVQILIDMLLNKQHEAPAVLDEWSEGKADPVQKLKRQLAEKEKLLTEEQEALVGAQAKLKEIRAEQAAERSQLQQRSRALEETVQAKQLELQSTNNRLHTVNQNVQQLQVQLNEEIMKSRKLMDEHAGLQMQRQQLEHHLAQSQEAQVTVAQLQNDLQELQAHNNQLTKELLTINEQKEHQQTAIVQMQHQLGHFTKELDEKDEIIRQVEESRAEVEHRLSVSHKQEGDLKVEISQLKASCQQQMEEMRRLELSNNQSINEIHLFQEQEDGYEKMIFQLKSELQQVQDEKLQLEAAIKNGSLEESKTHKIEVMNLHNEISSVKSQLQQTEKNHASELDATIKKLQTELDEQKNKNNVAVMQIRLDEQQANRSLIQRLFPDIKINDSLPQDEWISNVEKAIQNYIINLERPHTPEPVDNSEVVKLQAQIKNYKSVIDDTEGMLNKLQAHIEQEEINWRNQIVSKEVEIEALKQQEIKQLQTQLQELQLQLSAEQEAKQRLSDECQLYKSRNKPQGDTIAQIEKLTEEVNRLTEELHVERTRNAELLRQIDEAQNISLKTQNHNSSNGPSISIEVQ